VVGAALIDLISYVPRLPAAGETLHGHEFRTGFGGKGANQAAMAAKLGARVSIVTRVGRDTFGDSMLENFRALGVDTSHVGVDESVSSGVAPIAVDPNGENAIVIVTGANARMAAADIERAREAIAAADVLVCQLEIPHDATLAALRIARDESTVAILNPAPAAIDLPHDVYELADVLCPNESEAALILGRQVGRGEEVAAIRDLRSFGARAVVLTLGERGCAISTDGEELLVPAEPVAAVDTTGAGDAFVGTLAVGLALGERVSAAAIRANHVAAMSVRLPGTQASFPSLDLL
jgi:ribokinase